MPKTIEAQKERLMNDLQVVIADAEALFASTAGEVSESVTQARLGMKERLQKAKDNLLKLQEAAANKAHAAGQATDAYVHAHPWQSMGVATGVGLVVGMLISRR